MSSKQSTMAYKSASTDQERYSSTNATHGSLNSSPASSNYSSSGTRNTNREATSNKGQRENWALNKWLEQAPHDEPWKPGSRRA